jgi:hypothetical protein
MEMSMLTAIQTELPRTRIAACYFHFCQALWRKIQDIGLQRAYHRDGDLKEVIEKVMAIGYLPVLLVRNNFECLVTSHHVRGLQRRYPTLEQFFRYFTANYLDGMLQPSIWNVFKRDMDMRTNNFVECKLLNVGISVKPFSSSPAFHKKWNSQLTRHPSLWTFIRSLKDEHRLSEISGRDADNGGQPPARKMKWRRIEKRIRRLKKEYRHGRRDLERYWAAVRHTLKHF